MDVAGHVVAEDLRHWVNDGAGGWGIPMVTDVAFALGALALLGARVPAELKVLLLGLAIVDDVGAIVVIAAFYSDGLDGRWALAAAGGLVIVTVLGRAKVRHLAVYVALGAAIWFATFESGVHATIAGVALGLFTPARPLRPDVDGEELAVTERLQDLLHPWTSYVIVPVFALANAGVVMSSDTLADAASSPVTRGVVAGLVLGKLAGVASAIALVTKLGIGRLPEGITSRHVVGMAGLAGIGFTVSIFVTGLAFDDPELTDQAKVGVLVASALAAVVGGVLLRPRPGVLGTGAAAGCWSPRRRSSRPWRRRR